MNRERCGEEWRKTTDKPLTQNQAMQDNPKVS
jgi:hypothetical protein